MLEIICKVCFGLCFIALTATIWICWQRPDLWIDLNVEFKAYDSQWNFNNQPMEMHIRHDKDKEAVREQNQEQLDSRKRLFDMKFIEDMNADPLPTKSHFNTVDVSKICEGSDAKNCAPTYLRLENRIRTAPKYNLAACMIHKSMSTVLQAIMCFLYDEKAFLDAGRVFSRELTKNRFCFKRNEYSEVYKARKAIDATRKNTTLTVVKEAKPALLAIVRNPIDRFLSAYVDKCIRKPTQTDYCNGCKANMTCFILSEYERLMQQVKSKRLKRSFEDVHFFPQGWRCNFDKQLDNYRILYYNSHSTLINDFVSQLNEVLEEQGVPHASLEFISDQIQRGRTIHSTVSSHARMFLEKRLKSSPYLMEFLVRMFYGDYAIFEYEMPKLDFSTN